MTTNSSLPDHSLPQDRSAQAEDVVVIGGGIVGLACAAELARRGAAVTVLERDKLGYGCTFGNAGWLTTSLAAPLANPSMVLQSFKWMLDPESPLYIQPRLDPSFIRWLLEFLLASRRSRYDPGRKALIELSRVSVDMWEELAARSPEPFGFERRGLVTVYESQDACDKAAGSLDYLAPLGVQGERWSAQEVREKEPSVVGPQVGGYFFPGDGHLDPYGAALALAAEGAALGVRFLEDTEVYGIAGGATGPRLLRTTRGEMKAARLVVATGGWSEELGAMLGIRLPVIGAKGYSLLLPRREPHPSRAIYLIQRKVAVTPHADTLRLAGTLELVRKDFSINQRRVGVILRGAKALLDLGEDPTVTAVWRGLRPCTPDGMPLIGRSRAPGEVWLATGHQMAGHKTATGTGVLLAQLMAGEKPMFDPAPFRADRY
jgi:D-amino-acid dehydrogenase